MKNICVCVERRHEYKQKSNYGETMKGNLPYFYIKENLEKPRVYGRIDEVINKKS